MVKTGTSQKYCKWFHVTIHNRSSEIKDIYLWLKILTKKVGADKSWSKENIEEHGADNGNGGCNKKDE